MHKNVSQCFILGKFYFSTKNMSKKKLISKDNTEFVAFEVIINLMDIRVFIQLAFIESFIKIG